MKLNKCGFLLFLLLSFSLNSQTLKDNREKRKISISLGYNLFGGVGFFGAKVASLDYGITGNWKVGATIQYVDTIRFFNSVQTQLTCMSFAPCQEYTEFSPWTGKIFTNYFPFSGAFYLLAAVGKLPDFSKQTIFYGDALYSLEERNYENKVYDQAITYTISTAHNYYFNYGFGWRWDLDIGLLFGFDFGFAKEINRKRDIYFYADTRGLVDSSRIPTVRDIIFYQAFTSHSGADKGYGSINIYAGISF